MNWWIVSILVIAALLMFKAKEMKHKFGLVLVILFLLFLVGSVGQIMSTNDFDLNSFDGVVNLGKVYFSWLGGALKNMGSIGGYAVKQDWGLENFTNMTGG